MNLLGNHFHTDVPLVIPDAVEAPARWLREHSLPRPPARRVNAGARS